MQKNIIIILLIIAICVAPFQTVNAWNVFKITSTIQKIASGIKTALNAIDVAKIVFPFGGKIIDTGVACKIHYKIDFIPGPPIPILGTRIDVGEPGIPTEDAFTFPGISQIYVNHHEKIPGYWTLGLALEHEYFEKTVLDPINAALGLIPPICAGLVCVFDFSLSCPDGGLILKIGTS